MSLTMKDVMTANCAISNAEMLTSNHCAALAREPNKLLAAPVPPAGGSLKCWNCKADFTLSERANCDGCCWKCGNEIDLDDYVTRLQAENAALQQRLNVADQRVDDVQSELTKARELLTVALTTLREPMAIGWEDGLASKINKHLAHQSAPAELRSSSDAYAQNAIALQSELAKARELLQSAKDNGGYFEQGDWDMIDDFLAQQSAPAAKDGNDE